MLRLSLSPSVAQSLGTFSPFPLSLPSSRAQKLGKSSSTILIQHLPGASAAFRLPSSCSRAWMFTRGKLINIYPVLPSTTTPLDSPLCSVSKQDHLTKSPFPLYSIPSISCLLDAGHSPCLSPLLRFLKLHSCISHSYIPPTLWPL